MKLLRKLRFLFRREAANAEMTEEMRHHLEKQMEQNLAAGMSPNEARYAARRAFGGVEQLKERARDQRGLVWLEQFRQDWRYAVRALFKARAFTVVAVLTLGLGIGVNTSLFSVVYGVLLEPYPYAKPGEIWAPRIVSPKTSRSSGYNVGDYLEIANLPGVAQAMTTSPDSVRLTTGDSVEVLRTVRVSGTAFSFLGVTPVVGRGLTPADFRPNGEPEAVVVLSFKLWQRLFDGDPAAVGKTITLNDTPHLVVGVMPPRFTWYTGDGAWLPLSTLDKQRGTSPIVRLKPGVTSDLAAQQLQALYLRLVKEAPTRFPPEGVTASFQNYLDVTVASGEMKNSLHLLLYAVGFLLLIACTNVANLQLARGAGRSREMAVRLALGASRGRVFRQLLTENLVLATLGGALGVCFAYWLTQLVVQLMPSFYVPGEARVTLNGWVLLFSVALSMVTGVLFGLMPALQSTRADVNDALKDGGHGSGVGGRAGNRLRNTLVVVEVALSIVLLVGATLAMRGFVELQRIDRGFRTDHTLILRVPLSATRYPTLEQRNNFCREFIGRVRALPGVVTATMSAPPGFEAGSGATIPGQPKITDGILLNYVDADYVPTLGITLRAGRNLTEQDVARGERVAVITESAAKLWADGTDPIGRVIAIDSLVGGGANNLAPANAQKEVTVVGIVADVRARDKRRAAPSVLVPYSLRGPVNRSMMLRTQGDPKLVVNLVRAEMRAMDREQPMLQPAVLDELLDDQVAQPRFNLALFGALAAIALALAAAGIYGVLSYNVAQRTRELGLRIALGAAHGDILRLVLGAGGRLLALGVVIGLTASAALAQLIKSQIFGVPLLDPLALGAAVVLLSAAALLACWLPARRAAKVDPMVALRCE